MSALFDEDWSDRAARRDQDLLQLLRDIKWRTHTYLMDHVPFMLWLLDTHTFSDELILRSGRVVGSNYDAFKPRPGRTFNCQHMPDMTPVLASLDFTTLVKKKGVNAVYFFSKAFPFKC
jgi:hypothetical protein